MSKLMRVIRAEGAVAVILNGSVCAAAGCPGGSSERSRPRNRNGGFPGLRKVASAIVRFRVDAGMQTVVLQIRGGLPGSGALPALEFVIGVEITSRS